MDGGWVCTLSGLWNQNLRLRPSHSGGARRSGRPDTLDRPPPASIVHDVETLTQLAVGTASMAKPQHYTGTCTRQA